ncbi:MAG: hypothetical protein KC615_14320 [Anaerolineae bacterium]|nr:hypothetical protein [Anaerolineae bacterium]
MSFDNRMRNDPDVRALELFNNAYYTGIFRRFVGRVLGKPRQLKVLSESVSGRVISERKQLGVRTVRLSDVLGTVTRPDQFDIEFYPTSRTTRDRWLSVAAGMIRDFSALPTPEFILFEDIYYVEDGHHRVSVARRLGYLFLDANVTEWLTAADLPHIESSTT